MIKQLKNAIYGPNGRMEMKELVICNLLLMVWFMVVTSVWPGKEWTDMWIMAIPLSLIGAVFGSIYQQIAIKKYEQTNPNTDTDVAA